MESVKGLLEFIFGVSFFVAGFGNCQSVSDGEEGKALCRWFENKCAESGSVNADYSHNELQIGKAGIFQ